jgi:transposase
VRGKQRYQYRACGYNFVFGDERHSHATDVKKPCVLSYTPWEKPRLAFWPNSCRVSLTTTYYWLRQAAASTDETTIAPDIQEIEFDEMWHLIQSQKEKSELLKPWIVAQGEPLPGYLVVVMLQRSNGSTTKSNI